MDKSDFDSARLEHMFRQREVIIVGVTKPLKRMIQAIAARRHISMSDLIREAVIADMKAGYPEYEKLYREFMREEADRVIKGDIDAR